MRKVESTVAWIQYRQSVQKSRVHAGHCRQHASDTRSECGQKRGQTETVGLHLLLHDAFYTRSPLRLLSFMHNSYYVYIYITNHGSSEVKFPHDICERYNHINYMYNITIAPHNYLHYFVTSDQLTKLQVAITYILVQVCIIPQEYMCTRSPPPVMSSGCSAMSSVLWTSSIHSANPTSLSNSWGFTCGQWGGTYS